MKNLVSGWSKARWSDDVDTMYLLVLLRGIFVVGSDGVNPLLSLLMME